MRSVDPGSDFESWREAAKGLLGESIPPSEVIWEKEEGLFDGGGMESGAVGYSAFTVPKDFVGLARNVACHCDEKRWALLYRILWRIVKGGERNLCAIASDSDVARALFLQKNVRREIHKMHAFVRFKLVDTDGETGRERYVAWFEPDHFIVKAGTPFFRKRFANMDWSIFTPKGCAHWDGKVLRFSEGVAKNPVENPDALERAWRTYYASIFNPARVKVKAMKAEMPVRYWKNLPEAGLIEELIDQSKKRVGGMMEEQLRPAKDAPKNKYLGRLREMTDAPVCHGPQEGQSLEEMAEAALNCRGCPLWGHATGTVFGEGPAHARVMIVGEQPGDQEDVAGRPFIGPAGKLLREALSEAGLAADEMYLTNAVKHFKWTPHETPRGKMRLHQRPGKTEIDACRPWVLGELNRVAPEVLILLGRTAGESLVGKSLPVMKARGLIEADHLAPKVILTVHPSYLLRLPKGAGKQEEYERFVAELKLALQ
ncbi:UdgX family uracil-DNA binding protein [Luteolibacter sp. AS25]|uniref:UdgX family uracil-DNA binding protein n=1 Tax=Luteolibacter sp. AS25 TaxID=3135776 RepID=UPI00398B28AD